MPPSPSPEIGLIDKARRPGAPSCVVLIHGLGGDPGTTWGPAGAPSACAARLARDLPDARVCHLGYDARPVARLAPGSPPLSAVAEGAEPELADLFARHVRVALVGHCLGGLLARMALRRILGAPAAPAAGSAALVLLDAPEDWPPPGAPGVDARIAAILRAVGLSPAALRESAAWWSDPAGPAGGVWDHAILSAQPNWITPLSPGGPVLPARRRVVDCAHAELAQVAPDGPDPRYAAILNALLGSGMGRTARCA